LALHPLNYPDIPALFGGNKEDSIQEGAYEDILFERKRRRG